MPRWSRAWFVVPILAAGALAQPPAEPAPPPPPPPPATPPATPFDDATSVERLRAEAAALIAEVKEPCPRRFLVATSYLPFPGDREVFVNRAARKVISPEAYAELPETDRAGFLSRIVTEHEFYYTKYGSPLAYIRPLELLCEHAGGGWEPLRAKRLLDFGYGTIGHLRLLASTGMDCVGVEVDPLLPVLYRFPDDTGVVPGVPMGEEVLPDGRLTLVHGRWPADEKAVAEVGTGFDVILSKNTLKNGYINPEYPVDKRMLVDLGVSNETFVKKVFESLNPGGLFLIYNICPAQNPDPAKWIPWADGRCPFPREMVEAAGFEVIAFDKEDDDAARRVARALQWNVGPGAMDIDADLYTHYTILRRPHTAVPPLAAP